MEKDKLEKKVSGLLEIVAGKGIREFYEDSCNILSREDLSAPEKAVGNFLREIQSALFSITVSLAKLDTDLTKFKSDGELNQTGQIDLVIDYFKLCLDPGQIKFWKDLNLHKLAHRSGLKANKKISDEFIKNIWIPYSEIILEFLECINKAFLEYYERLEHLAKHPSKENRDTLLQKTPNNPHLRDHFFEKIDDFHTWLPLLKSKGVFEDVPSEYVGEDGYLVTEPWPPLKFLIRIIGETQDKKILTSVAEITSSIPDTDNFRVNDDILILAGKLPAQLSSKYLISRTKAALENKGLYTMGEKVSSFLLKLNEGGFKKDLLEISEKVIFDKKLNPFFEESSIRNNMNFYSYNGLLGTLSSLNDIEIFKLFLNRVLEGLVLSFKDNKTEKYHTIYWKHAFKDEVEKNKLILMYVSKLSLAAKNLISSGKATTNELIEFLAEANRIDDWYIINALILDLLEGSDEQINENLKSEIHEKLCDYENNRRERRGPEATTVTHVSPYSNDELSVLSAKDVIEMLEKFDGPIEDFIYGNPSRKGLIQNIDHQIKQRPLEFAKYLEAFKKLTNTDYACLIYSFYQAEFELEEDFEKNFLSLVNEFSEKRYDLSILDDKYNFSRCVFRIFRKTYNSPDNYLHMESIAFKVLDKIVKDKSIGSAIVSSTREERFYEMANHSINTPSIEALKCLIECYLTPSTKWKDIRKRQDFNIFKSYILRIVQAEESAPFRFMIGKKIHSLLGIGEQWFNDDLKKFILNKDRNEPWEAFVAGMMAQNIICNDVLDNVYRDAIHYVNTEEYLSNHQEQDDFAIENGIGRHISFYYCQLDNQHCTEDSLTNYIFVHGSLSLKFSFLTKSIKQLKNDDSGKKAFYRLKELINWRYEELKKINFPKDKIQELSGFLNLFPTFVNFDPEWSLKYLKEFMELLETNGEPFHPDLIIDTLIEQAENFPMLTVQCLLSWVKNMKNNWHDFNDVQELIKNLYSYNDEKTNIILKEVISRLSSKGLCRDLIQLFRSN